MIYIKLILYISCIITNTKLKIMLQKIEKLQNEINKIERQMIELHRQEIAINRKLRILDCQIWEQNNKN